MFSEIIFFIYFSFTIEPLSISSPAASLGVLIYGAKSVYSYEEQLVLWHAV